MSNRWCLALLGAVTALGSIAGACFGLVRLAAQALDGVEEPL